MKKVALTLAMLLLACVLIIPLVVGCHVPKNNYQINLITPKGNVQKSWTFQASGGPRFYCTWSGITYVKCDGVNLEGVYAPSGWLLTCDYLGKCEKGD